MATNWNDLVKQGNKKAEKKPRKPYVLKFGDEPDVIIPFPDGQRSMDYEEATSGKQQLRILLGRDFSRVWERFRNTKVEVLTLLIKDIWDQWDDDSDEVPGGKEDSAG